MDRGKRAITIDEVPLEWCFQPGVKLDFRHFPDGYVATARDVEAELERIGHTLAPLEIVLVNTSAGAAYGRPDYVAKGCGMGREATLYLLERGVRVTGTDGWSWDAPFVHTQEQYLADPRRQPDLGGPQGRPRDRLLPHREAAQSRSAAGQGIHGELLSGQDARRLRRLDARGRHHRLKRAAIACARRKRTPGRAVARDSARSADHPSINMAALEVRLFQGGMRGSTQLRHRLRRCGGRPQDILRAGRLSHARHHRDQPVSARRRGRCRRRVRSPRCSSRWCRSRS